MYQNLMSTIKKKSLLKYLIIGLLNTFFSYFSGIFFLYFYYENFGALFVSAAASVINIFFSFCNYKFFFFKTKIKYFFSEYLKIANLKKNDAILIFSVGGGNEEKKVSINLINAIKLAKNKKSKVISIVGKNDGYAFKNSDICIFVNSLDKKLITPISESFQVVIWHLLVSHPDLQINSTKW